jgi:hypothetical protein
LEKSKWYVEKQNVRVFSQKLLLITEKEPAAGNTLGGEISQLACGFLLVQ